MTPELLLEIHTPILRSHPMIHVEPATSGVPVIVRPCLLEILPYDETRPSKAKTHLVARSTVDERVFFSLDSVDLEGPDDPEAEQKIALATTMRWWRVLHADAPGQFTWAYGGAPIPNGDATLSGPDLERVCASLDVDLAAIDYALQAIANPEWSRQHLRPPYDDAMLVHQVPLFPDVVNLGKVVMDPQTGEVVEPEEEPS